MSIGAVVAGVEKAHFERQAPREDWARVRVAIVPVGTATSSIIFHATTHRVSCRIAGQCSALSAQRSSLGQKITVSRRKLYSDKAYYTSGRRA
jgi:hypothetical protein